MAPSAPFLPPATARPGEADTRGRRPDERQLNAGQTRPVTSEP
jgi:hypothetical protein